MKLELTRPCTNCPFRDDIQPYLRGVRAYEIADDLLAGKSFTCHQTTVDGPEDDDGFSERVDGPNAQHCAGALIMLEHMERPNQIMRWFERLGGYDRNRLDMKAPVYHDAYKWATAVAEAGRRNAGRGPSAPKGGR